jgi:tetratricopeptide (TPR) repeat protein
VAEALRRRRRHGALGRALHRLGEAAASASGREAARGLCEALSGYLSARLDAAGRGMTPADVGPALEARGVEAGLAGELAAVWQRGFDAVYASAEPEAAPMGEACRRAAELLREMDARLRRGRRDKGSAARAALILAAALLLAPRGARAGGDAERGFLWEEANSLLAVAQTEEECLRAAETYARLVEAGARNAPLFYNLGTALLTAGRHEDALAALRRAERYSGSNPEIRRNMLLAVAGRDGTEHPALPWTRSFLFWHYDLGLAARLSIAVVAFAGIWIALLLRALRASRVSSALLSLSLVALCAFGSSAAASLHQEYRDAAAGYHFRPPAVPQPSGGNAP